MIKTVQVVMLPTIEKNWPKGRITKCICENSYVPLGKLEIDTIGHKLPNYMINTLDYWEPQHLYFISTDPNEEIKEGDWVYEECKVGKADIKEINKCKGIDNENGWIFFEKYQTGLGWCKKIIASTNKDLDLPIIPQQVIKYVLEEHLKLKNITPIAIPVNASKVLEKYLKLEEITPDK